MSAVVGVAGLGSHRRVEQVMGMPVSVALRGHHSTTPDGEAAWQAVVEELRDVDRVFSTYRPDSMISRLDRGELTLQQCPAEVTEVLVLGSDAEDQSGGAFSITLPDSNGRPRLDPSGVVKGWAVERAARHLAGLEDTDFCLSAGGDMVCRVTDPGRPAWRVGIEHPLDPTSLVAVVPVRSGAVATSGARHRGQHLLDARTGRPASGVASVTVIDRSLTWADIDATAAYAHGPRAAEWLQGRGRTALVVWPDATTTVLDGRIPAR
ncbi:thiamine biosynthesis lipoprotein [Friedmanniella luteola]|uniref:FAD:protein FMN transferase n=1 Tax=Friedmanniella luteola TaxID=546871 RepID=A0A1H1L9H7_9ACTN|nr:FAD:protein FMN transferase [Friedmanniella luteola]SDR71156.1 thiamine biosynthesis lipoprotein [Friedmanniella luteola]